MATRKIFVRVAEPHLHFVKEDVLDEDYVRVQVFGFDELGDPTMPVFEVPATRDVLNAINNEPIITFDDKGIKTTKYTGRLIEVEDKLVDQFPRYYGPPIRSMKMEEIADRIVAIRREQKKGDAILGEDRKPFSLRKELFEDEDDYHKCLKLIETSTEDK